MTKHKQIEFYTSKFSPEVKYPKGATVKETEKEIIISEGKLSQGMRSAQWPSGDYLDVIIFDKENPEDILKLSKYLKSARGE